MYAFTFDQTVAASSIQHIRCRIEDVATVGIVTSATISTAGITSIEQVYIYIEKSKRENESLSITYTEEN